MNNSHVLQLLIPTPLHAKSVSELGPQGTERSQAGQKESDGSEMNESFTARR